MGDFNGIYGVPDLSKICGSLSSIEIFDSLDQRRVVDISFSLSSMNFSMAAFRVGILVDSISIGEARSSFIRPWLKHLGEEAELGSCES